MKWSLSARVTAVWLALLVLLSATPIHMASAASVVWDGTVATRFQSGKGTKEDPYILTNATHLALLTDMVLNGDDCQNTYFKMANDIPFNDTSDWEQWGYDANGKYTQPYASFIPIGRNTSDPFKGHFDGNGHAVIGLFLDDSLSSARDNVGLFGYVRDGSIRNLTVSRSYINGHHSVGAVAGYSYNTAITDCHSDSTVIGNAYVGGIVGQTTSSTVISDNSFSGTVKGADATGGIAGIGTVTDCRNSGTVGATTESSGLVLTTVGFGGIVGKGSAVGCVNSGTVSGKRHVGGIVGLMDNNRATVFCHNRGAVSGENDVGGIVGRGDDNITDPVIDTCFNSGDVKGSQSTGGIVGYAEIATVTDCYNTAAVSAKYAVGGILGECDNATVSNCYSVGSLTVTSSRIGDLVADVNTAVTVSNCYYAASSPVTNVYGTPLTEDQLRIADSFTDWNFLSVWEIGYEDGYAYPTLREFGSGDKYYVITRIEGDTVTHTPTLEGTGLPLGYTADEVYDFAYWVDPNDNRYHIGTFYPAEKDLTLTAVRSVKRTNDTTWNGTADLAWDGSGTQDDPYLISNPQELAGIAYLVNSGSSFDGHYFLQTADLVLNEGSEQFAPYLIGENEWTPIGTEQKPFYGHYDGGGHTVDGLYLQSTENYVGLFGKVLGSIKNLTLTNVYLRGGAYVGGAVAYGTDVTACSVSGTVIGTDNVGGVVGYATGHVTACVNTAAVSGRYTVGGVVARIAATTDLVVSLCINHGAVTGQNLVGGILGTADSYAVSTVTNCFNTAPIIGTQYVGGVAGRGYHLRSCYNIGLVTGNTVGGVTEQAIGDVTACYYLDTAAVANETDIPLTDEQMRATASFEGWDFLSVWETDFDNTYPYPTLRAHGSRQRSFLVTFTDGDTVLHTAVFNEGETLDLTPPSDDTYDFAYWLTEDGTHLYPANTYPAVQNLTLEAVWAVRRTSKHAWDGTTDTAWEGSGTKEEPYLISSPQELAGVAALNDERNGFDSNTYFSLTADILLNDSAAPFSAHLAGKHEWTPIGNTTTPFRGRFDGNGHTVDGLFIHSNGDNVGLFGVVENFPVERLSVNHAYVRGNDRVGILCGSGWVVDATANGTVFGNHYVGGITGEGHADNCRNLATVNGTENVGGISGNGNVGGCENLGTVRGEKAVGGIGGGGTVTDSRNGGNVSGSGLYVGGILGIGPVEGCQNSGAVTSTLAYCGGIVGSGRATDCQNSGTVSADNNYVGGISGSGGTTDCINHGTVRGANYVGGVVGYTSSQAVTNCRNDADVNGNICVGGVVGYAVYEQAVLSRCVNAGAVTATGAYAGGVLGGGDSYSTLTNSYNVGTVNGTEYVGGLAGRCYHLNRSYNVGTVSGTRNVSGVAATKVDANGKVQYTYYLNTSASKSSYGTALTDEQMRTADSFTGFGFSTVWEFAADGDLPYPTLQTPLVPTFHTVVYEDADGTSLGEETLMYGAVLHLPAMDDALFEDEDTVYVFSHWSEDDRFATRDVTLTAVYKAVPKVKWTSAALSLSVPYGYAAGNLAVDVRSLFSSLVCTATTNEQMLCDVTWDLTAYDAFTAGEQVFTGYLPLTASPFYTMADGAAVTLTVTVLPSEDKPLSFDTADLITETAEDGTLVIVGYHGQATHIRLPQDIDGVPVTAIGERAFADNDTLVWIALPPTVNTVGARAFENAVSLREAVLPEGITTIGERAFFNTKLQNVSLPASLETIGEKAFGFYDESDATVSGFTVYAFAESSAAAYAAQHAVSSALTAAKTDEQSRIDAVIRESLSLSVAPVEEGVLYEAAATVFEKTDGILVYDVALVDKNGDVTDPDHMMTVRIPVPAVLDAADCRVYRINSDGSCKDTDAVLTDGYMVFYTDQAGCYALLDEGHYLLGDFDDNETVNMRDAMLFYQSVSGVTDTEYPLAVADHDQNGIINMRDVMNCYRIVSGQA